MPRAQRIKKRDAIQQEFMRSASARLPRKEEFDGDKKREESMKRLLEWKQRMLQSPLTRKTQGYHSMSTQDVNRQIQSSKIQKSRSEILNVDYNSYSSDDEGNYIKNDLHFFFVFIFLTRIL